MGTYCCEQRRKWRWIILALVDWVELGRLGALAAAEANAQTRAHRSRLGAGGPFYCSERLEGVRGLPGRPIASAAASEASPRHQVSWRMRRGTLRRAEWAALGGKPGTWK